MLVGLLAAWLLWHPPSPDLAAQVYRVHLFSIDGLSLWDNSWYGGHYLLGYSLIFPPLASVLGLWWTGAAAVTLSSLIFWRLVAARFGRRAAIAETLFVLGASGDLFIGRVTFALGVTFALASVLALVRGHRPVSALLSLACAATSPVAAAFLVLAACADLIANRRPARAAVLALPAVCLTLTLDAMFPEGGYEPFALSSLLAAAAASGLLVLLLPRRERLLRCGAGLYLLALLLSYALPTPMGSNAVRFGVLFAPAVLAGCVEVSDIQHAVARYGQRLPFPRHHPRECSIGRTPALGLLGAVSGLLVLWQVAGPLEQSVGASLSASCEPSFYAPAIAYLDRHRDEPMRIEVPFTSSHWDATILGERFDLARGWERQLDTRYDGIFYATQLTARAYHAWLLETGVRYVVLAQAPLDFSSIQEAALIRHGLPFLRIVFANADWRIYEVRGAQPLASGPGELTRLDGDGFTLDASRPGKFLVRVRYTPYWRIVSGSASVSRAPGGWTVVSARRRGPIALDAGLPLDL